MPVVTRSSDGVFALLDDARSSESEGIRTSRLYSDYQNILTLQDGESHAAFFGSVDEALERGLHAVGLFSYEFGYSIHRLPARQPAHEALVSVLLFGRCEKLSADEVESWLACQSGGAPYAVEASHPALDSEAFAAAVASIHRYIESGDTYQVNFTFPLRFGMHGSPVALYAALRKRQPVPYGALVALPDGAAVLSLSPELFVSHASGKFTCKPMKGTASASGDVVLDAECARVLRQSPKERSENLMIVDLLRNDLGRIALTGSVKVPDLFAVERFGAVLQMTSTIEAVARPELRLPQVLEALYPCGSIVGAPKHRTMQLLQQLERWPRRLYAGAIGWFEPPASDRSLGDFVMSVPIRTLLLDAPDANDRRRGEMGIGAGIVYDSHAQAEYQECLLKARFLTGLAPGFQLFETMHAERGGCRYLERHLARLSSSAAQLSFSFDEADARHRIEAACNALAPGTEYRLRLALDDSGTLNIQTALLAPLDQAVRVLISPVMMCSDDALLAHKTTLRRTYDEGWRQAEAVGAFDTLFFNERGELTEGGRSNVFVRIDGQWRTPPLFSGLLPGVMRAVLLEDPSWNAVERPVTMEDLRTAQAVCICNALRGVMPAVVDGLNPV